MPREMSTPLGAGGKELGSIFFRKAASGVPEKIMQGEKAAECTDVGFSRAPVNPHPWVRGWL